MNQKTSADGKAAEEALISCLKTDYGIEVASLTSLDLGADLNASIYKVLTPQKQSYFIKLKAGRYDEMGIEVIVLLEHAGVEALIRPVKSLHGRAIHDLNGNTVIVYPFINGQDGFHTKLTGDQWILLGKALRKIHEVKVPASLELRLRKESFSGKWREILRSIEPQIEGEPFNDELAFNLQMFMKNHQHTIHRLVCRAELLAEKLQKLPLNLVLCHSDIHAGNLLIDEHDRIYIVDFDEPILAPKERDLMFIGGGVGNVWNVQDEERLFYQGYGKTQVNLEILSYYRHERIVEDIAIYCSEIFSGSGTQEQRLEMYGYFMDLFAPQGVIEIAFKTDQS